MEIEVKSSNGIRIVPLEAHLLSERWIFVSGVLNKSAAGDFIRQIILLNCQNSYKPIQVLIDIADGDAEAGLLMYDAIQSSSAKVDVFCIGRACGIGALILASATGKRSLLPHSIVNLRMSRKSEAIGIGYGPDDSKKKTVEDKLIELFGRHTKMDEVQIKTAMAQETDITPEQCIEMGIADSISGIGELLKEKNEYER